jgi:hypothetical protein
MMSKFNLNYNEIAETVDRKTYKYAYVKNKLVKVAFDLVRFQDQTTDELWQIQNADDGSPVIVALYEEDTDKKTASDWSVQINKTAGEFNVFYKQTHLKKFASSTIGVEPAELDTVKRFLPKKLAGDKSLATALLNELPKDERQKVLKLYPELA